jgi:hypothetical protein
MVSPSYFISTQLPPTTFSATQTAVLESIVARSSTATLIAQQLGNAYLLLGMLGLVILNTTTELQVVRGYLWALWAGDIGHVGFTLWAMGWASIVDVGSWSPIVWGNVGATLFLFLTRTAYFLGAFGGDAKAVQVKRVSRPKGRKMG